MATLPVDSVGYDSLGKTLTIVGMLLSHDFICWLVPHGSPRRMHSIERGIRVLLPGLGAEVWESPFSIVTNGRPSASIETVEITGLLEASNEGECNFQLSHISSVVFRTGTDSEVVEIETVGDLSEFEWKSINAATTPEWREGLLRKFRHQRSL